MTGEGGEGGAGWDAVGAGDGSGGSEGRGLARLAGPGLWDPTCSPLSPAQAPLTSGCAQFSRGFSALSSPTEQTPCAHVPCLNPWRGLCSLVGTLTRPTNAPSSPVGTRDEAFA